jgi:hypothetical protein
MDMVDGTTLPSTETESSQTETDSTDTMTTPSMEELSRNASVETTTEGVSTTVTVVTMEEGETMTPLDKFTTASFGSGKAIETTLETETESSNQVKQIKK